MKTTRQALEDAGKDADEHFSEAPVGQFVDPCPEPCLVSLRVVSGATQHGVQQGHWATVKKDGADVIVEATTDPNTEEAWSEILWSGDAGRPVAGKLNQRAYSRGESAYRLIMAELGGETGSVAVWIIWAEVTILTSGEVPAGARPFGTLVEDPKHLGAARYVRNGETIGAGKIVAVATVTPPGVHSVITSGLVLQRETQSHVWLDGNKLMDGKTWTEPKWADDSSEDLMRTPALDVEDRLYDSDAPLVERKGLMDTEVYHNFRQWVEWRTMGFQYGGVCSDREHGGFWHFQGRWQRPGQILLCDVGPGHKKLPERSFFHPRDRW